MVGFPSDPIVLAGGVGYYRGFISPQEADDLFAAFLKFEWRQHILQATGPDSPLYVWMGIPCDLLNSANKIMVAEWTPEAEHLKLLVEEKTGCTFDSLEMNLYRDHRDYLGFDSGRKEAGKLSFPIASVSLGAERRVRWTNINDESTTTQLLEHGSLVLMPPSFRCDHRFEMPKQEKLCGPRINLTFG